MRRLVVASAILATLLIVPLGLAAATPTTATVPTDSERATAALEYLLAAQEADGSIDGSLGQTADFVIGAAAAGYDPATLRGCAGGTGALSFLATASDIAATDAAQTGKAILAVVAAGDDPTSFRGRDLVARLGALYHSADGTYGDGSTFSQSFAILAVVASGGSVPAAATADLVALQDTDGSWNLGSAPGLAGDGDTNSTAIALMALDAAGVQSTDAAGLVYLRSQQLLDGGFPYQNSSTYGPPASDPDSDSIVLQALVAGGQDPEAAPWLQGSSDVLTHLRAGQGADGGFAYAGPGSGEDAFTTSQVPAALVRVPYAAAVHPTAGLSVATRLCPGPSSSPSVGAVPSTSATAGSSPTVVPTAAPTTAPTPVPTPSPAARPATRPTVAAVSTPAETPTESATQTPTESPAADSTPAGVAVVAGATAAAEGGPGVPPDPSGSPGGSGAPLAYAFAALAGMVIVVGGGWLLLIRSGKR